jgi:hypothetical protein
MVNGAWSGRLVVEFLLQVFTIRQVSARALSLTGLVSVFRICLHCSSERRFSAVVDKIDRV